MVNKRKGDARELRDKAKKMMTSDSHKGYNSCFEPFSERDEEILAKCCDEVSKSLQDIFAQYKKKTESNVQVVVEVDTGNSAIPPADQSSSSRLQKEEEEEESDDESESFEQTTQTEDESTSYRPDPPHRRSSTNSRRRSSSVGTLAQFLKRNSLDTGNGDRGTWGMGISEAILKFELRSHNELKLKLQKHEQERRLSDSGYLQALSKKNRMNDYHKLNSQRI
jgi:hypothetical protein